MPGQGGAASGFQQREAIAQASSHLLNPKHGGAGGGELDGKRYAVELPADRGDFRGVLGTGREV